jgi:hypothetical protein
MDRVRQILLCAGNDHSIQSVRRVCRYQRGNQNPYIEKEQTTQWPKEKVQKDKQRSTKHTYKTKDRVTYTLSCLVLTRCDLLINFHPKGPAMQDTRCRLCIFCLAGLTMWCSSRQSFLLTMQVHRYIHIWIVVNSSVKHNIILVSTSLYGIFREHYSAFCILHIKLSVLVILRKVWRYQRGNQKW